MLIRSWSFVVIASTCCAVIIFRSGRRHIITLSLPFAFLRCCLFARRTLASVCISLAPGAREGVPVTRERVSLNFTREGVQLQGSVCHLQGRVFNLQGRLLHLQARLLHLQGRGFTCNLRLRRRLTHRACAAPASPRRSVREHCQAALQSHQSRAACNSTWPA